MLGSVRCLGLLSLLAVFLLCAPVCGQQNGDQPVQPVGPLAAADKAPEADDHTFVWVNPAMPLPGCQFRGQGSIEFDLEITRFGGPTTGNMLADLPQLHLRNLVGDYAILRICSWDVDDDATGLVHPDQPELDEVFFNGENVYSFNGPRSGSPITNTEYLAGEDNKWVENVYRIPMDRLKFPNKGINGAPPTPMANSIRIDIDTENPPTEDLWCTAVAWASLEIQIMSPIVLVHGNSQSGRWFSREGFTAGLDSAFLVYDKTLNFIPNATSIARNSGKLDVHLMRVSTEYGVDSLHLVAHSKGGLDSRDYLARFERANRRAGPGRFEVLSLTTLSTPHDGSMLADLAVNNDRVHRTYWNVRYSGFPWFTELALDWDGTNGGHQNLTTRYVRAWSSGNLRSLRGLPNTMFAVVSPDMDNDGSGVIDVFPEAERLGYPYWIVNRAYQLLGTTGSFFVTVSSFLGFTTATVHFIGNAAFKLNDALVTQDSSQGLGNGFTGLVDAAGRFIMDGVGGGTPGKNHATVGDQSGATLIAPWIVNVERTRGDLR